jgi:hypothetical protein
MVEASGSAELRMLYAAFRVSQASLLNALLLKQRKICGAQFTFDS